MNSSSIDDISESASPNVSPRHSNHSGNDSLPDMVDKISTNSDMTSLDEEEPSLDNLSIDFTEMDSVQEKFAEIMKTIDAEDANLQTLELRHKKLEQEILRLQKDIKEEKVAFNEKIKADLAKQQEQSVGDAQDSTVLRNLKANPHSFNAEELQKYIQELRGPIDEPNQTSHILN